MFKKSLIIISSITVSSLCYAETGFYTSAKLGAGKAYFDASQEQAKSAQGSATLRHKDANATMKNISIAAGYDFSKNNDLNIRTELEYTHRNKSKFTPVGTFGIMSNGTAGALVDGFKGSKDLTHELRSQSLMLNAYYDFKNNTKFTPYVGLGLGATRLSNTSKISSELAEDFGLNKSYKSNATQLTGSSTIGLNYEVNKQLSLDLAYKYTNFGSPKFQTKASDMTVKTEADYSTREASFGVRYSF